MPVRFAGLNVTRSGHVASVESETWSAHRSGQEENEDLKVHDRLHAARSRKVRDELGALAVDQRREAMTMRQAGLS